MVPKLPEAFLRQMALQLGDRYPDFTEAMSQPARRGLRLNASKPLPEAVVTGLDGLGGPIPWAENAFFLDASSRLGATALHEAGAFYLQEPSAMLPAAVLAPKPGERVLDLCAAPGGKSTQLAAMLRGEGLLIANEIVPARARILSRNLERMGISRAIVVSASPDALAARWAGGFDAVLVDAPCSGEGMFRRDPETIGEWRAESPAGCATRQKEILASAAHLVRPGGRMVYATCTYNTTENEGVVEAFLADHPDFALTPFALPGIDGSRGLFTCYPHVTPGEGQFCALLTRAGDTPAAWAEEETLPVPDKAARQALRDAGLPFPADVRLFGETLVSAPPLPSLLGLKVLRCGLHLGSIRNNRFVPDHAWAVSDSPPDVPRVEVTEAEAVRYLAGETLTVPESLKGWVLPSLHGLPLGWGKAAGGVVKNHYPKGLRRNLHPGDS